MKNYALTLQTQSPLAIRSDHAPGGAASAQYIPGSTLAGSLAAAYRLYYPDNETGFQDLFLKEQVWFPNLYPASFKKSKLAQDSTRLPVYPLPKTAQSCKRFPGFAVVPELEEKIDEPRHGVRDSLLDWVLFTLADQMQLDADQLLEPLEKHKNCSVCNQKNPMAHLFGYYRQLNTNGPRFKARVDMRLQTHNGISRETGTVQEGILYNREVIEEDNRFWGLLKLDDKLAQPFEQFIAKVGDAEAGWLRVGTGRTRGLGKVNLRIDPFDGLTGISDFRTRLERLNTLLQEKAAASQLKTSPFYFALTLHSPVILCNDWQGYYTTIDAPTLASMIHLPEEISFKLIYQSSGTRRISGWNEQWGTPRANEIAIDTGSVFLFACNKPLDDMLTGTLFQLEEEGMGRRKTEGFGRICISDPFHQEVELR